MPKIPIDRFKLVTLLNLQQSTPQMIIGLDIGTTNYGISIASDDLKQAIIHQPSSYKTEHLNETIQDLREHYEFFGIVYGHADKQVSQLHQF